MSETQVPSTAGGDEINLNMPKKSAHDVYLLHAMNKLGKFDQILFTMSSQTDPRIVPYARQCIGLVLDDKIKRALMGALNEGLEYIRSTTDVDMSDKGSMQIQICQAAVSEVYSYLDEFIGLSKTNAVVPLASTPTPEEIAAAREILASEEGDIEIKMDNDKEPDKAVETAAQAIITNALSHSTADKNGGDVINDNDLNSS